GLEGVPERDAVRERDALLDGHEVDDHGLRRHPPALPVGAVERRDDEERGARRRRLELVDQLAQRALVGLGLELRDLALVGPVLKDDERRVAQIELVFPVGAVLALPVEGHGGVRAERVVDHPRFVALERDAEESNLAPAHGANRQARLAVAGVHDMNPRGLGGPARREALGRRAVRADFDVPAPGLLEVVDVVAGHPAPEVAARRGAEERRAAAVARERDAAEPVHAVGRGRAGEAARRPRALGRVEHVVVEVPLPGVRRENEPVPRIAEAGLEPAADRSRDEVTRDRRVAVVENARDRAGLLALGALEAGEEGVERVAGGVVDGHGAERRADGRLEARPRGGGLGGARVVDGRRVLRGRQRLLACGGGRRRRRCRRRRLDRDGLRFPRQARHAKELQLRGDVGNGENAEHHDESARRLPGQRVLAAVPLGQVLLTRSHIPSYGTRTALAKATRATRPTELSTGPGDPSAWAARPTARAPERRALSPAAGAPRERERWSLSKARPRARARRWGSVPRSLSS